jgi:hypothetical protein
MIDGKQPIPWYKRSLMAPVWVTVVLAFIFGGMLTLMYFDMERLASNPVVARHATQNR